MIHPNRNRGFVIPRRVFVGCGKARSYPDFGPQAFLLFLLLFLPFETILHLHAQEISDPNLRPITFSGSLLTSAENYSLPGIESLRPVNSARLYFNPTVSIYGVQLPFSVVLSTSERSFYQPFNQFGVSPSYKWFTLHAGYRSLHFSEFSLSDQTIFGAGAEVRYKQIHGRFLYGRFRRAIDEDSAQRIQPVFKRMGWAAGIGLGSEESNLHLNLLHAWDDSGSLNSSALHSPVFPEENLIFETAGRIAILDKRLQFDGGYAVSFYTRDVRQPPLEMSRFVSFLGGVFDAKISTRYTTAFKAGAAYHGDAYSIRLEFARVEPEFNSMGTTYIQNDRQDVTISPSLRLFENSLHLSGSIGFRRDNLMNDRGYTTNRIISSANLNWSPAPIFGLDAQYSNYSMANASASSIVNDTTRVENITESFSLSPRLLLVTNETQHFILLHLGRQQYADRNILTGMQGSNDLLTFMCNYSTSLAGGWGVTASLQYTDVQTAFLTNIIRGITVGGSRAFFNRTLNTSLTYGLNLTKASNDDETDTQHVATLSAQYRMTPADAVEFRFQYNNYHAVAAARSSYAGTTTRLQYSRIFR